MTAWLNKVVWWESVMTHCATIQKLLDELLCHMANEKSKRREAMLKRRGIFGPSTKIWKVGLIIVPKMLLSWDLLIWLMVKLLFHKSNYQKLSTFMRSVLFRWEQKWKGGRPVVTQKKSTNKIIHLNNHNLLQQCCQESISPHVQFFTTASVTENNNEW